MKNYLDRHDKKYTQEQTHQKPYTAASGEINIL